MIFNVSSMNLISKVFQSFFVGRVRNGLRIEGLLSNLDKVVGILEPACELDPVQSKIRSSESAAHIFL